MNIWKVSVVWGKLHCITLLPCNHPLLSYYCNPLHTCRQINPHIAQLVQASSLTNNPLPAKRAGRGHLTQPCLHLNGTSTRPSNPPDYFSLYRSAFRTTVARHISHTMSHAPTLINLPPTGPPTPSDAPGTPNSTTTSMSELST